MTLAVWPVTCAACLGSGSRWGYTTAHNRRNLRAEPCERCEGRGELYQDGCLSTPAPAATGSSEGGK